VYVEEVLSGKTQADSNVGRELTKLLRQIPKMTPGEFEEMLNTNMKVSNSLFYLFIFSMHFGVQYCRFREHNKDWVLAT